MSDIEDDMTPSYMIGEVKDLDGKNLEAYMETLKGLKYVPSRSLVSREEWIAWRDGAVRRVEMEIASRGRAVVDDLEVKDL